MYIMLMAKNKTNNKTRQYQQDKTIPSRQKPTYKMSFIWSGCPNTYCHYRIRQDEAKGISFSPHQIM